MTWRLALPAAVLVIVGWAGLAAAGVRSSGPLVLLVVAPTVLAVTGLRARSVVRRHTTALLGLGLGLWTVLAWAWLRPLTGDLSGTGPRCGSALLPSPRATIDDPSGCLFPVLDQLDAFAYPALGAVVVSVVACCSVLADAHAATPSATPREPAPTRRTPSVNECRLGAPTA